MKNYLLRNLLILCFLSSSFVATATEDPTNITTDGTVDDDETPIDNGLVWLGIAGVAFGLYFFSTKRKDQIS